MSKRIHRNSAEAYAAGRLDLFPKRSREILELLNLRKRPMTDREIKDDIGFEDMNSVRPRITEMVEAGVLAEVETRRDPDTGRPVRVVAVAVKHAQTDLFIR